VIFTLAVLLLQFPAIPQSWNWETSFLTTVEVSVLETTGRAAASQPLVNADPSPDALVVRDLTLTYSLPTRHSRTAAFSLYPRFASLDHSEKLRRRKWLALSIVQHSAATFDAWSTRQAISTGRYRELNPALRPFAGNASLYGAIQVGPLLLDCLGRRMMRSQYGLLRHTWWIPQAVSTAISLGSGAHNLSVR
jgi:hypothetical protein